MAAKNPTRKQKNLAKLTLAHPTMPKGELVALGSYSKAVQKVPSKALESQGYLVALDELGLTNELLTTSLVADIKAKPKNRKAELELGFKVRGQLNPEIGEKGTTITNFTQIVINQPNGTKADNKSDREAIPGLASVTES